MNSGRGDQSWWMNSFPRDQFWRMNSGKGDQSWQMNSGRGDQSWDSWRINSGNDGESRRISSGSSCHGKRKQRYKKRQRTSKAGQVQAIGNDASAQQKEQLEGHQEAADLCLQRLCKLSSAEGDIFEVEAPLLCRHSTLVGDLIEDHDDEEIPLPGVKSETLRLLVEFCKSNRHPGILRSQANLPCDLPLRMLCELLWAAKLLNMKQLRASVSKIVSQQVESGDHGQPPFDVIPTGLLHDMLHHGAKFFSQELLCNVISSVAQRTAPEHEQLDVEALLPYLGHKHHEVVNATVTSLQQIGAECAQLALLTHQKYIIRLKALPILSKPSDRILDAVFQELQNPCWLYRVTAVHALGRIAPKGDVNATAKLLQKLKDPVREVRDAAVNALHTTVIPDDPDTIDGIMELVSHCEWPVQCAALRALSFAAPGNPKLVESLAEKLEKGSATVVKHTASRILKHIRLLRLVELGPCPPNVDVEDEQTSPSSAGGGLRRPRGPAWCDADSDDDESLWPTFTQDIRL